MAAGLAGVVGLAGLFRRQLGDFGPERRQVEGERPRVREVVVIRRSFEGETEAAHAALGVHGNSVGGAGCSFEFNLAVVAWRFAQFIGGLVHRVVVAGDRCERTDFRAGVDSEQGVDAWVVAACSYVNGSTGRGRPRVPEGVAAGVAGVVGLAGLLGGEDGRVPRGHRFRPEHRWGRKVVVFRSSVEIEREDPLATPLAVDGDPVGGAGHGFDLHLAAHLLTGGRRVVVGGHEREGAERVARVDGKQGVGGEFEVGTGGNGHRAAARRRPRVPNGVAAGFAGVVGLTGLLGGESGGAAFGDRQFRAYSRCTCEVVVCGRSF